jgi:hypothetical protein
VNPSDETEDIILFSKCYSTLAVNSPSRNLHASADDGEFAAEPVCESGRISHEFPFQPITFVLSLFSKIRLQDEQRMPTIVASP